MAVRSAAQKKLDALIDLLAPEIREGFFAAIRDVVDNVMLKDLIEFIQMGDFERAFQSLGFSQAAMRPLTAAIERAYETGGIMTGETFPKYLNTPSGRAVFRFDVRNSRAEAYLRERSSTLVTRLGEEARGNVRNVLTRGMEGGRNPRNVALDLVGRIDAAGHRSGGIVGLTRQQEYWVANTRRDLLELSPRYFARELRDKRFDATVARAIKDGTPLPAETVEKLVTRYKDNALKFRGEAIARTEAIQSLNASEYEATLQAVDNGAANMSAVQREWDTAGDTRVRDSHEKMDGQRVGLKEAFVTGSGARLMYPGDISLGAGAEEIVNCRCRVKTVVDWLADLD
jgi:hypothetical protein